MSPNEFIPGGDEAALKKRASIESFMKLSVVSLLELLYSGGLNKSLKF